VNKSRHYSILKGRKAIVADYFSRFRIFDHSFGAALFEIKEELLYTASFLWIHHQFDLSFAAL
jgi:hypothetical protein